MKILLKSVSVSLLIALLCSAKLHSQDTGVSNSQENGFSIVELQSVTDTLQRYVDEKKIAGVVAAVTRNGALVYAEAMGYSSLESQTTMKENSIFRIYSMTKPITSVAAMILYEKGMFELEDPVSKYIPAFKNVTVFDDSNKPDFANTHLPSREVTIKDLLIHTSGLNHRFSELYTNANVRSRAIDLPALINNVVNVPLMEEPGTNWRYSISPTILGYLIEIWSGVPLDEFMSKQIFEPLSMVDTEFWVPESKLDRFTTVYTDSANGLVKTALEEIPFTEKPKLLEGTVGLVSTVPDYLKFCQMLLNTGELNGNRILNSETIEAMRKSQIEISPGLGFGYGFSIGLESAVFGWGGSGGTQFWIDPKNKVIGVIMMQMKPASAYNLLDKFEVLINKALAH